MLKEELKRQIGESKEWIDGKEIVTPIYAWGDRRLCLICGKEMEVGDTCAECGYNDH